MIKSICIFGASSNRLDAAYLNAATELGRALAKRGLALVFGGGDTGLMGAAARGAHQANGRVIGVIPEKLNQPGIAYPLCDELIVTADMHSRKSQMERISDGYVALPGGLGTLEELFEVLTLNQLGYITTPIVILNTNGYFDDLIAQIAVSVREGMTGEAFLALFAVAETPDEAVNAILTYVPAKLPDKIKGVLSR